MARRLTLAATPLALGLLACPSPAEAGGWTQPLGSLYAKVEVSHQSTTRIFDGGGRSDPYSIGGGPGRYSSTATRAYLEYGLSPLVTVLGSLDWKQARISETAARFTTRGFGDVTCGLRFGWRQNGAAPLALQVELSFPTHYDATDLPALGAGRTDGRLAFQAGHAFRRGYLAADLGYRLRTRGAEDQIVYSGEVGVTGLHRISTRLAVRGHAPVQSKGSGLEDPAVAERGVVSGAATLGVALTAGLTAEIGATQAFWGRNTLRGPEYSAGIAVRL